jgi:hypothetical protein
MRHASTDALDTLEDLLAAIRRQPGLTEKKRGIFYRKSNAFLHFHEDPAGLFADLRSGARWERLPVNTSAERDLLLGRIEVVVSGR